MRRLVVVVCALMSGSCATQYQPMGLSGGFSELRLNADTYQITVSGNGYTSADRAQNIALLRAAELTIGAGFQRFSVLSGNVSSKYAGATPIVASRYGSTVIVTGGNAMVKPNGTMVVRMLRPDDPSFAAALDAALISAQLTPLLKPE